MPLGRLAFRGPLCYRARADFLMDASAPVFLAVGVCFIPEIKKKLLASVLRALITLIPAAVIYQYARLAHGMSLGKHSLREALLVLL